MQLAPFQDRLEVAPNVAQFQVQIQLQEVQVRRIDRARACKLGPTWPGAIIPSNPPLHFDSKEPRWIYYGCLNIEPAIHTICGLYSGWGQLANFIRNSIVFDVATPLLTIFLKECTCVQPPEIMLQSEPRKISVIGQIKVWQRRFGCSSSAGVVWSVLPIVGNRRKAQCVSGSCLYWSQPPNCQSLPGWGGGD